MLLVVSDLHFVDGSAGEHNLPPRAYEQILQSLDLENRLLGQGNAAPTLQDLEILFLGDIFDVVRSRRWFRQVSGVAATVRPWGTRTRTWDPRDDRILGKTRGILQGILSSGVVQESCGHFVALKQRLMRAGARVRYTLVPGNHDRIVHADPVARREIKRALRLDDIATRYTSDDYRVVAFHGHEVDLFNFGAFPWETRPFTKAAYGKPSVGEAITIELAVRIHDLVDQRLENLPGVRPAVHRSIMDELSQIDNVRPAGAVFAWLQHFVKSVNGRTPGFAEVLDDVVATVFRDFSRTDFVRRWSEAVDQRWLPDSVSAFKRAYATLTDLDFHEYMEKIDSVAEAADVLGSNAGGTETGWARYKRIEHHPFTRELQQDLTRIGTSGKLYVVYGHTHIPEVVPMKGTDVEYVLFNTGTFRPRVQGCGDDGSGGFIQQKTLSCAMFYKDREEPRGDGRQYYEFWDARLGEHRAPGRPR